MNEFENMGRSRLIAEIERLQSFKTAYMEWSDKTDWVQESAHWSELGRHRADVIKDRFQALKTDAERYRWMKANVRNGSFGTDTGWIDDDTEHWDDDLDLKMGITTLK